MRANSHPRFASFDPWLLLTPTPHLHTTSQPTYSTTAVPLSILTILSQTLHKLHTHLQILFFHHHTHTHTHTHTQVNLLILESPAGVGYSYCKAGLTGGGCNNTDKSTAAAARAALQYFFAKKFPELKANKFFITGESYAGVYV